MGSLGKEHARIYADLAAAGLVCFVGVFDVQPESAKAHAEKHRVRAFATVNELLGEVDAVSVVTPTVTHHALASQALG